MLTEQALETLITSLDALLSDPSYFLSSECRAVRERVTSLHSLILGKAFGGRGHQGQPEAEKEKERRLAALRQQHQARDADKKAREVCGLRAGRMAALERLAAAPHLPSILDGVGSEDTPSGGAVLHTPRSCYTCKQRYTQLHSFYDSLCPTCAALNFERRHATADLTGRVAVVTGARVKIGFHVALKLLRAGATVIATSRFPRDAAGRFAGESDSEVFSPRLHIFGLDFRDLPTLEAFAAFIIKEFPKVDILINNACQTVRRPAGYYRHLLAKEGCGGSSDGRVLPLPPNVAPLLRLESVFQGTGRTLSLTLSGDGGGGGGNAGNRALADDVTSTSTLVIAHPASSAPSTATAHLPHITSAALSQALVIQEDSPLLDPSLLPENALDINGQQVDLRTSNSWTHVAEEVTTPELAEVLCINTMAPFVLCARLKGVMSSPPSALPPSFLPKGEGSDGVHGVQVPMPGIPGKVCAWIVNVSSMEGRFYFYKAQATHPHTNMAKSALNMFVRTSAKGFAEGGVFMSAVDTGWINEELPRDKAAEKVHKNGGFATPLDEVDAAARILDPVFSSLKGVGEGGLARPFFGGFWKDYKVVEW